MLQTEKKERETRIEAGWTQKEGYMCVSISRCLHTLNTIVHQMMIATDRSKSYNRVREKIRRIGRSCRLLYHLPPVVCVYLRIQW